MTPVWVIGLVVISTILSAFANLFLKIGSTKSKGLPINTFIFAGLALHGLGMIIFIFSLQYGALSVLYPFSSLIYIWVMFLSIKYLKEQMNIYKWLGVLFIVAGVVFVML